MKFFAAQNDDKNSTPTRSLNTSTQTWPCCGCHSSFYSNILFAVFMEQFMSVFPMNFFVFCDCYLFYWLLCFSFMLLPYFMLLLFSHLTVLSISCFIIEFMLENFNLFENGNFTFCFYCSTVLFWTDNLTKILVLHAIVRKNSNIVSTRFIQAIHQSMRVRIICFLHSQCQGLCIHFLYESLIVIPFHPFPKPITCIGSLFFLHQLLASPNRNG